MLIYTHTHIRRLLNRFHESYGSSLSSARFHDSYMWSGDQIWEMMPCSWKQTPSMKHGMPAAMHLRDVICLLVSSHFKPSSSTRNNNKKNKNVSTVPSRDLLFYFLPLAQTVHGRQDRQQERRATLRAAVHLTSTLQCFGSSCATASGPGAQLGSLHLLSLNDSSVQCLRSMK